MSDTITSYDAHPTSLAPSSSTATRTIKIRFLDQLSPDAQKAYHDEQERKKEEKKSKIEELGEIETKIDRVEQPSPAVLASQTAENTQYNRHQPPITPTPTSTSCDTASTSQQSEPPPPPPSASVEPETAPQQNGPAPTLVDIQTHFSQQV